MIRASKHRIDQLANSGKNTALRHLLSEYKVCLKAYIDLILSGELPLKNNLSSKDLPILNISHSRYRQLIYKQASEIIRSGIDKAKKKRYNNYKRIYVYFKRNHPKGKFANKKFSELNLKDLIQTRYFKNPNVSNVSVGLDERFFDIMSGGSFDQFVKIILPVFNDKGTRALQVRIPLKSHKQANKLLEQGFSLRKNIQLKEVGEHLFISFIWEKEELKKKSGITVGIDLGVKKLIVSSEGQMIGSELKSVYDKLKRRVKGSKGFKRTLRERDNVTNYCVNKLDLDGVGTLCIEELNGVKHKKSFKEQINKGKKVNKTKTKNINRKNSHWVYPQVINKLERTCCQDGILLVKVSPAYTSQSCSGCGNTSPDSRKGENYRCVKCDFEIDADLNAAINIRNRGEYSLSDQEKDKTQCFI